VILEVRDREGSVLAAVQQVDPTGVGRLGVEASQGRPVRGRPLYNQGGGKKDQISSE
jgi:hypothetical protein